MGDKGKRSTWRVADRCLDILVRLMAGPATSRELLEIVHDYAVEDEEPTEREALLKRFEDDRGRMRHYWYDLSYNRSTDEYTLDNVIRPFLNLSDEAVRGLAFLQETFSSHTAPMRGEVNALIDNVQRVISSSRRRDIERVRGMLEVEIGVRDNDYIPDEIRATIEEACSQSRLLQLRYKANREDGGVVLHQVEPLRHFFDTVRCHFYLEAFCLETWSSYGPYSQNKIITYRMGRIQNATLLEQHFRRGNRRIPEFELVYELSPEVARVGVTQHFPGSQVIPQANGGATVHALSKNLFFDVRTLLHYGPNCKITGGDEAIREMKQIVKEMYEVYQS